MILLDITFYTFTFILFLYYCTNGGGWEDRTPTSCLQSTCAPIITNPPISIYSFYVAHQIQSKGVYHILNGNILHPDLHKTKMLEFVDFL